MPITSGLTRQADNFRASRYFAFVPTADKEYLNEFTTPFSRGNVRIIRRKQQLVQSHSDGQNKRVGLEPVKHPAEVRGQQGFPLSRIERSMPGLDWSGEDDFRHEWLFKTLLAR
jgi:hypothetical protein